MIFKEKKIIFIHIYKTGGKSISEVFRPYVDRFPIYYKVFNKLFTPLHIKWFPEYLSLDPHSTALQYKDYLGEEFFKFYKFTFVRNPYSWEVSKYFFMKESKEHFQHKLVNSMSFEEYITWRCTQEIVLQKSFIVDKNGNKIVDFIGKLENLNQDILTLSKNLNIALSQPKHLGASTHDYYKDYYNKKSIVKMQKTFMEDFETFGYDPEI